MISPQDIVACICEGNTEKNIISILLENNDLIFTKEQLLDNQILQGKYKKAKIFSDQYLTMDYGEKKLIILLIQDHKNSYVIKAPYSEKIKGKYLVVTAPEIEMLMIHSSGLYNKFQKSKKKPSLFLSEEWKIGTAKIKNTKFIKDFYEKNSLVDAIKVHSKKSKKNSKYKLLYDILKSK